MATNQLICIKRPEPGLAAVFEDMYLNERLVDVTLSCSDGQLQAHRLVLAASSPYFSSLFAKIVNPFHYPVIIIKDMLIEDLRLVVDFMYKGQLTINQDRLVNLVKCAENLQIAGLSNVEMHPVPNIDSRNGATSMNDRPRISNQRFKRVKKSSGANFNNQQSIFVGAYQSPRHDDMNSQLSPQPDKLLSQSMMIGDSMSADPLQQHISYSSNDPTSTKNLNQHLQTPSPSINIQHLSTMDQQQQQLSNQLQVLSQSLTANRSSLGQSTANSNQHSSQLLQQPSRGRVHPCNICWKTFREKANLKRHLQVHSLDRVVYACPDCNKTFSWKDNYIRHTKTAHHMNNLRTQP